MAYVHCFFSGLLNSPSKSRTQNFEIDTGIISWGSSAEAPALDSASALDWSEPVAKQEDELVLNWDDDPVDADDESPPMSMKLDKKKESVDVAKPGPGD